MDMITAQDAELIIIVTNGELRVLKNRNMMKRSELKQLIDNLSVSE